MGIFNNRDSLAVQVAKSTSYPFASPWTDGPDLNTIVFANLTGFLNADQYPIDRAAALTIPAVRAAHNLLTATAGSLPLKAYRKGAELEVQPAWLTRTSSVFQNSYDRTTSVLTDLFFDGNSLLFVNDRGSDAYPLDVLHIKQEAWVIRDGVIFIDDKRVNQADCIFIQSPIGGLLTYGQRTLSRAINVERIVAARADTFAPIIALRLTENSNVSNEALQEAVDNWAANRRNRNGMVTGLPAGVEIEVIDDASYKDFLSQERSNTARDIAQLTGIPSGLLETTAGVQSDHYTTEKGQRSRLVDFSLRLWMDPIQARLSDGDVTPLGTSVRFDVTELLATPSNSGLDREADSTPAVTEPVAPAPLAIGAPA